LLRWGAEKTLILRSKGAVNIVYGFVVFNAAYGYLDDIDAHPEIQMVHVGEDE